MKCEECGEEFTPNPNARSKQIYCRPNCAKRASAKRVLKECRRCHKKGKLKPGGICSRCLPVVRQEEAANAVEIQEILLKWPANPSILGLEGTRYHRLHGDGLRGVA